MTKTHTSTFDTTDSFVNWKLFDIGFWFLMFSYSALTLSKTRWEFKGDYFAAPLLSIGMVFLLNVAIKYYRMAITQLGSVAALSFRLLIIWGIVTALRGSMLDGRLSFHYNWGGYLYAWTWFVPVLMILSLNLNSPQKIIEIIMKQGRLGIIVLFTAWVPPLKLFSSFGLDWGCSALLLFWHYISKGGRRVALLGTLLTIYFAVINSERNAIAGHGFLLLAASYIGMIRRYRFRGRRRLAIITGFLLAYSLVSYAANHESLTFLSDKTERQIQTFKEEFSINTRVSKSGVSIYQDFLNDMNIGDLIFGRGSLGTYKSRESGGIYRQLIECGYFHVILKGGIIMLAFMLLLAIPAAFKGLLFSRNWLVKGFAFIVVGWLLEMIPYGLPAAFPRYALFWISIGVCLNPRLRMMTDDEIEKFMPESSVSFGPNE